MSKSATNPISSTPHRLDVTVRIGRPGLVARHFGVLSQFAVVVLAHAALLALVLEFAWPDPLDEVRLAPVALYMIVTAICAVAIRRHYPHDALGLCNVVTHLRATLVSLLAAPLVLPGVLMQVPTVAWAVAAVAGIVLLLDGIDGRLARRAGLASRFGARFDVEIDALLALMLAVLAWQSEKAGFWILALGLIRYGFVAAGVFLPWLRTALPDRFRRKAICVIQLAALMALNLPFVVPPVSVALAAATTALLVWSFTIDVVWLRRRSAAA